MDRIRKVSYCFNLSASFQIYNVFHVILHRDHKPRVGEKFPEPQPLRLAIDCDVWGYKVEAIFASQIQKKSAKLAPVKIQNCMKEIHFHAANPKHACRIDNKFNKNNPEIPRDVRS